MTNKKTYFIFFDKHTTILLFLSIFFSICSSFLISSIVQYNAFSMPLSNLNYIIPIWIFIFLATTTKYKIKNNKLKRWYLGRKIPLNYITSIECKRNLYIYYTNKKGKQKKVLLFLIGLRNNKEKYEKLINDIIDGANNKSIVIEQKGNEIADLIYNNRISRLTPTDDKPLKVRGWLLLFRIYLIICDVSSFYLLYTYLDNLRGYKTDFHSTWVLFIGCIINFCLLVILYSAMYIVSCQRKKWAVKFIIALFYFYPFVLATRGGAFLYAFSPTLEPSVFIIVLTILMYLCGGLCSALLFRRYFTQSIRVKNTYIK